MIIWPFWKDEVAVVSARNTYGSGDLEKLISEPSPLTKRLERYCVTLGQCGARRNEGFKHIVLLVSSNCMFIQ